MLKPFISFQKSIKRSVICNKMYVLQQKTSKLSHLFNVKHVVLHREQKFGPDGLFQKIPTPPSSPWTTLNWVPKNFEISKKDSSSLCRIPNPANSNSWGIPEFCKILRKFWGNSWNSSQAQRAFITGFPLSSMGVCGYFLR